MGNRHQRRADLRAFRHDAAHARSLTTYLLAADDPLLDRQVLLHDAVKYWRTNVPIRRPICIVCRKLFDDETIAVQSEHCRQAGPPNASAFRHAGF